MKGSSRLTVTFRLEPDALGSPVEGSISRVDGRWVARSDALGRAGVGLGPTPRAALAAALAPLGPSAISVLLADVALLGPSVDLLRADRARAS
jgi:hypothetical protein